MGARINNFPTGLMYDLTDGATWTLYGEGAPTVTDTITGSIQNARNRNVDDFVLLETTSDAFPAEGLNCIYQAEFDRVIFNATIYAKFETSAGAKSLLVQYSLNGLDWSNLDNNFWGNDDALDIGTANERTYLGNNFKFLKIVSALTATDNDLKIYEMRVVGV